MASFDEVLRHDNVDWYEAQHRLWDINEYFVLCPLRKMILPSQFPALMDRPPFSISIFTGKYPHKMSLSYQAVLAAVRLHPSFIEDDALALVQVRGNDDACVCNSCLADSINGTFEKGQTTFDFRYERCTLCAI